MVLLPRNIKESQFMPYFLMVKNTAWSGIHKKPRSLQFTRLQTVTHPSNNQPRCRVTLSIDPTSYVSTTYCTEKIYMTHVDINYSQWVTSLFDLDFRWANSLRKVWSKYLLRPKFSRTNLTKVGWICMEQIAKALRAKLLLSLKPLQLFTFAKPKLCLQTWRWPTSEAP